MRPIDWLAYLLIACVDFFDKVHWKVSLHRVPSGRVND